MALPEDPLAHTPFAPEVAVPLTQITLNSGTPPVFNPTADPLSPAPPTTSPAAPVSAATTPDPFPQDPRGTAEAKEAPNAFPLDPRGTANGQPLFIPQTTTETTDTTSGVTKETAANINAATGDANTAADTAGKAKVDELNATADLERKQGREAYGRGVNSYFESLGGIHTQDQVIRETQGRLEETAKFKPDRTALFHGDNGVLFGISAAISAMAGGWLMGQGLTGGKNPYLDVIMRMIDQNANDQVESNSLVYRELEKRLGSAEAAKRELKARMYEAVNTTVEAQSRFDKASLVQKGAASVMAQVDSEKAKNRMEAAKLTGQTASHSVQRQEKMVANPAATGGIDVSDPKEYERVGKVQNMVNFQSEVESLAESGTLADHVGWFDTGWREARDLVTRNRARSPQWAKVQNMKARWEMVQRADWKTEPNGQAIQERLSLISFPQSDAEIPAFRQAVREAINTADPGGRYRQAARALGNEPNAVGSRRIPVVR